jgi:hypothetical protein
LRSEDAADLVDNGEELDDDLTHRTLEDRGCQLKKAKNKKLPTDYASEK